MTGFTATPGVVCLWGLVQRAEQVGIIQRGTHRLVDGTGRVIAALSSSAVNLSAIEGQSVQVCGINEGQIEGVLSIRVTSVGPIGGRASVPPLLDRRNLVLMILLTQPGLTLPLLLQKGLRTPTLRPSTSSNIGI